MTVHRALPDVPAPRHSGALPGFGAIGVLGALPAFGALTAFGVGGQVFGAVIAGDGSGE